MMFFGACSSWSPYKRYHLVQAGDTFEAIVSKYELEPIEFLRVNKIKNVWKLKEGDHLYLPYRSERIKRKKNAFPLKGVVQESYLPGLSFPLKKIRMTSQYGWRVNKVHEGVDFSAPKGTPILAAADAEVFFAGKGLRGFGNIVILHHGDSWFTIYAHASKILVMSRQKILRGQTIALVGSTGRSRGNHLHFEVRKNADPIDPLLVLPPL